MAHQGAEMSQHARPKIDAGVDVYFCDPHSPWQRGTNENTNGLLRQYFPKGIVRRSCRACSNALSTKLAYAVLEARQPTMRRA